MDNTKGRRKQHSPEVYGHYREKLGLPKLSKRDIEAAKANLEAIARAICEHVWKKKFY